MSIPEDILRIEDLESLARERMSDTATAYLSYVAGRGVTARRERAVLDEVLLRSRVMIDGRDTDTSATVLGHELALPAIAAPSAQHGLAHADAERGTVMGCHRAGSLACVSMAASLPIDAFAAPNVAWWQQLYPMADRGLTEEAVGLGERHGATALVVTVDVPGPIDRPQLGPDEDVFGLIDTLGLDRHGPTDWQARAQGANPTWDDLAWLRELAGDRPLIVKGVLDAEDAGRLAAEGVDGIVVSTHGGRQLDGAPAPAEVLPAIVNAVAGRSTILADGSVRSGTDILKLLVRGADAVMVGRPIVWGLACDGAAGVTWVLERLRSELAMALAMTGCHGLEDVDAALEHRP